MTNLLWVGLAEYQGRQGKGWGSLLDGEVYVELLHSYKLSTTHSLVVRFLRLVASCIKGEVA